MEVKQYYYLNGDAKVGPFTFEALKNQPIRPETMIWHSELPNGWVEARTLPEFDGFVYSPSSSQPPQQPAQPTYAAGSTFNHQTTAPRPMPDNYLVWAILATVLCCWPIGIFSIIQSTKVSSAYNAGDYEGAERASANAKKYAIWTAVGGGIFWVLYILFFVIIGMAGAFSGY